MYSSLLIIHNAMRWVALAILLYSIYRSFIGMRRRSAFSSYDNALRHWTATALQVQMVIGFVLYFNSPFVSAFWTTKDFGSITPNSFFAIIHLGLMFTGVTILSVGSAFAKRESTDEEKYRTMLCWFCISLLLVIIAIPWPFSPLSQRPLIRS